MSTGRHRGRGRAKRPLTAYQALDRPRRRNIFKSLILGRPIDPADEPLARDRATHAAEKLPQTLWQGGFFGFLVALYGPSSFPLTGGGIVFWIFAVSAVAVYLLGLSFTIRMRVWLRRHPEE